ncbi:uncharacterized protein Ecym_3138 [Eremothecium cymbalariae DBVPG|uniref:sphingosine kinase n=1 Tax=Eremothecium cymbalariae (strain CBS 270.75 / DBVPG 7215 / KCTC 17166 / NRRL Y-17582) TaxID=931890 RepID=G8JR73_ERECY|nr:Hypothetical protein Ecym_3138 [Eremothecium cymbalariae DBVPG\
MLMLSRFSRSYSRALLEESGIVIKDQGPKAPQHSQDGIIQNDSDSQTSSALETASLISCVTCLSDNTDSRGGNSLLLPPNTVIPYSKILDVRLVPRDSASSGKNDVYDKYPDSDASRPVDDCDKVHHEMSIDAFYRKAYHPEPDQGILVEVVFARPRRNDLVPKTVTLLIDRSSGLLCNEENVDVVEKILERSYKNTKRNKSILVIINPHGGRGRANKIYVTKAKPILIASGCYVEVFQTSYPEHAIEIARTMDIDKYDVIACASGDGIPYEVLNGLYRREDRAKAFNKVAVTQLPCGSGNAMSVSCHGTNNPAYAALSLVKAVEVRMDVMCCSQPSYLDGPRLSFLSQTYGVIAESDINTEFLRWIGPARFELGVTLNIFQRRKYPCEIYVKYAAKSKNELKDYYLLHKARIKQSTLKLDFDFSNTDSGSSDGSCSGDSIDETLFEPKWSLDDPVPSDWEMIDQDLADNIGIFYVGKMPYVAADTKFFPAALPDDGSMDMVITDARTPLTRMAPILLSLDKGSHVLQPEVEHSKIFAYRLVPKLKNSVISVDGEKFPYETLQVEVLPRLVKMLLKNGNYVETEFNIL